MDCPSSHKSKNKSEIHAGHRDRMKQRLIFHGSDSFNSHELMEMLLYYALPRQNTNEQAHRLMEQFGSLRGIFQADYQELIAVEGIKSHTASLILVCGGILRRIALEENKPIDHYERMEQAVNYLRNLYVGVKVERAYLMLFDNGMKLIDCINLGDGVINQANILPRKVIQEAILKQATGVLLAHNHPGGLAIPSPEDIEITGHLNYALSVSGVTLLDHLILTETSVMSIMNTQFGMTRPSPGNDQPDEDFYRRFYGNETYTEKL